MPMGLLIFGHSEQPLRKVGLYLVILLFVDCRMG